MKQGVLLIFSFFLLFFPALAVAQQQGPGQDDLKQILQGDPQRKDQPAPQADPYADLPEEYIQEAHNFYQSCQSGNLIQYYDCKCLASKFLDKRISMGPQARKETILLEINNQCLDATVAAGNEYQNCMNRPPPAHMHSEEFCECFANTYAKLLEMSGRSPGSELIIEIQYRTQLYCEHPERYPIPGLPTQYP